MHPDKSPGPNGFNFYFYKKLWPDVGTDVTNFCLHCLNTCQLLADLNETLIVLIPKVKKPDKITFLHPISLCNVVVKILTKVLANRLKVVLNSVFSEAQSAFIPGWLISDNVLIDFEVSHFLHRRTQGKMGFSSLKIDMSKVYDIIEWQFLEDMMRALGFAERWIKLVMLFVLSVKYIFRHNGKEVGSIFPTRGLRQGDPISPYLFLLCAEGLSAIILDRCRKGLLHGCKIARSAPYISHLLFADDSILFFQASVNEALVVKECLTLYEKASGQMVNYSKSSILFN
ncbi:hypothetical protein LguiA_030362 [Lonicera macranthoides]